MATKQLVLMTLALGLIFISGCLASGGSSSGGSSGHRSHHRGRHHDKDEEDHGNWKWGASVGIAVIFGISIAGAAIFSLLAWVTCSIYSKCRKDKVGASTLIRISSKGSMPPLWSSNLVFKPELAAGFGVVSEGFMRVGPASLIRNRPGMDKTDGAKWAVGLTKGKHVFEITWPWGQRGQHATIGLGTDQAALMTKGCVPMVGNNRHTWGLDIVKRRAIHNNRLSTVCPTDGSYVPDKFMMYIDLDEGTIGYGNDVTYWGEVIAGLPCQGTQPLYLMVAATKWHSELSIVYRGSAPEEGEDSKSGQRPYHLPPLYHVSPFQAPPSYNEKDPSQVQGHNNATSMTTAPPMNTGIAPNGGMPSDPSIFMVVPPANAPLMIPPPQSQDMEFESPPPYNSRPPTGCSMRSNNDGKV